MKFKTIFLIFNAVVLISFLFVFLAPLLILGMDYAGLFFTKNWFLAISFFAVLGAMNLFFAYNWRIFSLLEREDWPALSTYLSSLIFERARVSNRNVKVYVNALLLLSDLEGIAKLEALLRDKKPSVLRRNALLFGITKLLKGDFREAADFLAPYAGLKACDDPDWLLFDLAFARLVLKEWQNAYAILIGLIKGRSRLLRILCAYYLQLVAEKLPAADSQRALSASQTIKETSLKKLSRKAWEALCEEGMLDIKGVVLSKMVADAGAWLYEGKNANHS